MNRKILIIGATSAIARASAMHFAAQGDTLYLAGRDENEIQRIASDLQIRYGRAAYTGIFDIENVMNHPAFFAEVVNTLQVIDGVVLATGYMGKSTDKILSVNFTGSVIFLNICADYLAERQQGFIIGITSVAGDRGRQSNYLYGCAKGGLSIYLQGLRNRLFKNHVRVITVKPGFVDTAMTFGLPGLFLVAHPDAIGKAIANAPAGKSDVLYLPWFWRYIMLIIKSIPEVIFKRLSL